MKNRRTQKGYKLRVYMDAIKDAKATTDEQWIDQWATSEGTYVSRVVFLSYLEQCALIEAEKYMAKDAA